METQTPLIYSRIAACLAEVEAVGKNHKNQQQNYSFRGIDDFYDAFQPVLARNKVFITPTILEHKREERTTKSGAVLMTTVTHVRFKLFTEDGSFVEADALGEGSDSGDKSANKAAATAMKYLFMQVFSVRVNGESFDTERESPAYAPQSNRREYPVSNDRQYQKPAPQPAQRPAAAPADVLPVKATEKIRERAWNLLTEQFTAQDVWSFLNSKGLVPADGTYDQWPLEHVPTSKEALYVLSAEINAWLNPPTAEMSKTFDTGYLPPEIGNAVITVPRKGMKRDEYLKSPDTISSLYRAMKSGDEEAQKRLWGLAKGWVPEPYVSPEGKKYPVSEADAQCRIDLDMFLDYMAKRDGHTQAG
jgi:hypothetical protein